MELLPVLLMQDVVDTGVDELLLFVLQVLGHVVRHKHDAALPIHHKQEAIQCLVAQSMAQIKTQPITGQGNPSTANLTTQKGAEARPYLQQEGPQVVLIDDPLACGRHVRLLDIVVIGRGFSWT